MGFATTFTAGQRLTAALVNALTDGGVTFTESGFSPGSNALAAIIAAGDFGGGLLMKDGSGYGGSWMQDNGATMFIGLGTASGLSARIGLGAAGVVSIYSLPEYADDAAAIAGGLAAGRLYRTSAGSVQVVM